MVNSSQNLDQPPSGAFNLAHTMRSNWITRKVLVAGLLACLILVLAATYALFGDARPPLDGAGRPLGIDFSALWAAGRAGLNGDYSAAYSLPWFFSHLRDLFAQGALKLVWAYPPVFYFIVIPLAMLPYGTAVAIWLGCGFAALAALARQIIRDPLILLAVVAFPGVFGNAIHGQTGFLTASLLAGALLALPIRPVLAGILFACLAYKPQFALLLPVALAAGGYWRTFIAAAIFGLLLAAASVFAFGWESWTGFFSVLQEMRVQTLEQGKNGYHNMISVFAAARLYGLPLALAWVVQIVVACALTGALIWLWRSKADVRLKSAALLVAALGLTPYGLDYDLAVLGPAIAFFAAYGLDRGFRPWEHSLLALAFVIPPLARYFAFFLGLPLAQFVILAFFALIIARARRDLTYSPDI